MDQAQKIWATEVTWAEGAWQESDSTVINRPDWFQVTTPSRPIVIYNGVYRSILAEDAADAAIDRTLAHYAEKGLPFRWTVGPSARPADLAERLQRRGMRLWTSTAGMVIATDAPLPAPRPGITVERATAETLGDWVRAAAGGWEIPGQFLPGYTAGIRGLLKRSGDEMLLVLTRYEGEPAGAGMLQYVQGVGGLKGTAVRPEFRGRGVYQASVAWRLAHMRERGVGWAAVQAVLDTSAPILERMGFETVCQIDMYATPNAD